MQSFVNSIFFAWVIPVLFVTSCIDGSSGDRPTSIANPNVNGVPKLERIYPYQYSFHSDEIETCATLFLESKQCDVANIKPIGTNTTGDVSIEDIKSRLVISDAWMADSFINALLEINDQDLLNLFKPINTIVISYDIRPAFYHTFTASIYIDPRYLWRNPDEWSTIFKQDDYRSAYQTEFIFDSFIRYVDPYSSDYITWSNTYKETSYTHRTSQEIAPGLFRLLSHELAHANDYLPPERLPNITGSGGIADQYIYPERHINEELSSAYPLTSDLLYEAAQIAFRGKSMTDRIRQTTAEQAGLAFSNDGAADLYGYSTQAEDVAMLFEAFMMYKKYGAVTDVAFATIPTAEDPSCDEYVVQWGQRNRLADDQVKQRTILIGSRILNRDITPDLASNASAPTAMPTNIGWCLSRTSTNTNSYRYLSRTDNRSPKTPRPVVHDYRDDRDRH